MEIGTQPQFQDLSATMLENNRALKLVTTEPSKKQIGYRRVKSQEKGKIILGIPVEGSRSMMADSFEQLRPRPLSISMLSPSTNSSWLLARISDATPLTFGIRHSLTSCRGAPHLEVAQTCTIVHRTGLAAAQLLSGPESESLSIWLHLCP
ncbi:hypothetical protein NDU88_005433 [Pleurodeles waltl]|uniref:Uncharacterized protein n=1 Tax=Pleurodeles waltl TaxID=8319 RepID=A0AAV7TCA3_PLEWA|nr:hypothetical protein NDU88_005433 [Pleurodeles waltl]